MRAVPPSSFSPMVCALIDYFRPISAREIVQLFEIAIRSPFFVFARILMVSFFPHRLTAFVLRSFAQARPFIFVDRDELKQTQDWITKYQNPQDGCFKKSGSLFNKRLKVGVIPKFPAFFHFKFHFVLQMLDDSCESYPSLFQGGVSDEATLTAFVTVSLLETGMSPEVLLITCLIRSLQLAVEFCVQPLRKC